MKINFAVWAPDEQTFWQSWITAGICTAPWEFTVEYPGITISDQTRQGWVPTDINGDAISGWHANIMVSGPLVEQFTYGIAQTDADGNLLPIWDRTWAAEVFGLTDQPLDPVTNFPAGMRNNTGVHYADPTEFKSPTNVWQ